MKTGMKSRLREIRERQGLTVQAVAVRLQVSETTVRNWEKGRSTPRLGSGILIKIANVLGCSCEELLAAIDQPKND